jgi:hypothetical protein
MTEKLQTHLLVREGAPQGQNSSKQFRAGLNTEAHGLIYRQFRCHFVLA